MHYSVPLSALLACLGTYAIVLGVLGFTRPTLLEKNGADLQSKPEYLAVIGVGFFGLLAPAIGLTIHFGSQPYVPYLVTTPIVAVLGVGFWKVTGFTPGPLLTMIINTRYYSWSSRRRKGLPGLMKDWFGDSELDARSSRQADHYDWLERRARRGAVTLGTVITILDIWVIVTLTQQYFSILYLIPLALVGVLLIGVFIAAGKNMAARAKPRDWKDGF